MSVATECGSDSNGGVLLFLVELNRFRRTALRGTLADSSGLRETALSSK